MWIGLTGVAGSGKDTAAAHLVKASNFGRYAFADRLKQVCAFLYGDWILDPSGKEVVHQRFGKPPREIFQDIGELFRSYDPDFWVKQVARFTDSRTDHDIVFSDVRHDNEAEYVTGRGGFIIRIERDVKPVRDHVSEHGISDRYVSYTIHNTSTIGFLEDSVERIVAERRSQSRNYAAETGTLADRLDKLNGASENTLSTIGHVLDRLSHIETHLGLSPSRTVTTERHER